MIDEQLKLGRITYCQNNAYEKFQKLSRGVPVICFGFESQASQGLIKAGGLQ